MTAKTLYTHCHTCGAQMCSFENVKLEHGRFIEFTCGRCKTRMTYPLNSPLPPSMKKDNPVAAGWVTPPLDGVVIADVAWAMAAPWTADKVRAGSIEADKLEPEDIAKAWAFAAAKVTEDKIHAQAIKMQHRNVETKHIQGGKLNIDKQLATGKEVELNHNANFYITTNNEQAFANAFSEAIKHMIGEFQDGEFRICRMNHKAAVMLLTSCYKGKTVLLDEPQMIVGRRLLKVLRGHPAEFPYMGIVCETNGDCDGFQGDGTFPEVVFEWRTRPKDLYRITRADGTVRDFANLQNAFESVSHISGWKMEHIRG